MPGKIITITLNPAIDKSTTVPTMVAERKMKCTAPVFEPGGGGVNVARAIKKLGGNATAFYFAGGYSGQFFKQLLLQEEIESAVIEIARHTRENLIVVDKASNQQYRFGMPGPMIEETEWKKLLASIEKANDLSFIVASGSIPAGVPTDIYARIAFIAKKKKVKCMVDTSGEALKLAASEGVYLLKPNLGELSTLVGEEELNIATVKEAAQLLIAEKKTKIVLVSMGAAGAMLVTSKLARQIIAPVVKVKSTVGAGDSMVAGIVLSLWRGNSITDAVEYGVAAGTAATMNHGTALCNLRDADNLFRLIHGQ